MTESGKHGAPQSREDSAGGAGKPEAPARVDEAPAKPSEAPAKQRSHVRKSGWLARSHLLVAVLCAALGFAIVVQVRQTHADDFATLRQDDLVRLLDEITQRNDQLQSEQAQLILDRNDLATGVDAQAVAERNAQVQAVLAGTVPVQGPGIDLIVHEVAEPIQAGAWVNLVEELRNAGAEAIQIDNLRVGVSSAFVDTSAGTELDGVLLTSPIRVLAIGDPEMDVALEIPGGALATLRQQDATTELERVDVLFIRAVQELQEPRIAQPAPEASPE